MALIFISPTPLIGDLHLGIPVSVLAGERTELSASSMNGFSFGASSAVIDGSSRRWNRAGRDSPTRSATRSATSPALPWWKRRDAACRSLWDARTARSRSPALRRRRRRRRPRHAGVERIDQRLLVDQAAAGAVDDAHTLLHLRQRSRIDDVPGLLGQRRAAMKSARLSNSSARPSPPMSWRVPATERIDAITFCSQARSATIGIAGDPPASWRYLSPEAVLPRRLAWRHRPAGISRPPRQHQGDGVRRS